MDEYGRAEIFADGYYKFLIDTAGDDRLYDPDNLRFGQSFDSDDFHENANGQISIRTAGVPYTVLIDADSTKQDYATFAAYIADSPTAGDRVLINVDEAIAAKMTIPSNILIRQIKGKKFTTTLDLATVIEFGDKITVEGDIVLELSHTGTVTKAVSVKGDSNTLFNLRIENKSTGTITNGLYIEAGKTGNNILAEILNTGGGTLTNPYIDNSGGNTNSAIVRTGSTTEIQSDVTGDVTGDLTGAWASLASGTKMLFKQAAAPTGWTVDNTGLTDAANRELMVCAVHSNQYGADGGTQDPKNMTTPAQSLNDEGDTDANTSQDVVGWRDGDAFLSVRVGGATTLDYAGIGVNSVTLTPYYTHTIVATKD